MTEEIDDLYDHFSATSAALCIVLKRKSQIVQLTKRVCELHSVEQIDPELELIEASNKASFARLSGAKSDKSMYLLFNNSKFLFNLLFLTF